MKERSSKSLIRNMTEGPLGRQLITFALPIAGANLLQALYTLVDLWTVGNFADAAAISAVSISSQIVTLVHAIPIGLGNGGQVIIAQQVGAKDTKRLSPTIGTLLTFCVLATCVTALIGGFGSSLWVSLLNTPEEAYRGAINYLVICCCGAPFLCISGVMCSILRGMGESRRPMFIQAVAAVSNIIMDLIFVVGFSWGAAGAALATSLAQLLGAIYAVTYVYRHREALGFDFRPASFRISREPLMAILRLGTPLVIQTACITLSMIVVTGFINVYGVAASAITGIGSRLNSVMNVVFQSIQTSAASLVAQNFAAGRMDRVRRVNLYGNLICIGAAAIFGALMLLFPVQIVGLFTQATETEVLALAPQYMFIQFWNCIAYGLMSTSLGHVNGVGFTSYSLLVSILDGVAGRIGIAILLGNVIGMGVTGFWWGNALAAYISVFMSLGYFLFGHWEKRSLIMK